jgi:SAM-dependent methyltransferase
VESDLSNRVEGVPERFEPASMHGELTEAEHLVRYAWASRLAPGRRVLDAGCGLGYGARMLRRAGAAEVVGVDVAESVVEVASAEAEPGLRFEVGDVGGLDFEDGRFDLVVCFEVIEHVQDQQRVIGELVRVLAADGILVISSPNRASYVPGNPHHLHEYLPDELHAALAESLEHVRLWRQHDWICSAVLDDEAFASDDLRPVRDLWAEKVIGEEPGRETYTLALASDAPLPEPAPGAVITGTAEVRKWMELYHQQQDVLRGQHEYFQGLEDRSAELVDLRVRLAEAEHLLARLPGLEQEPAELLARAEAAEHNLRSVMASPSWRITSPLRALKRRLKR